MRSSMKWFILCMCGTLGACSGNTVFDYTPEATKPTLSEITSTYQALVVADAVAGNYDQWAANVARTPQLFDIPIIGTLIFGATELAYSHPHTAPATSAAIAAASLAVLSNYYNPRARVTVYSDAAEATRCIARVARPLVTDEKVIEVKLASGTTQQVVGDEPYTYDDGAGGKVTIAMVAQKSTDQQTKTTLDSIVFIEINKARWIADAISQVNAKAINRGLNASVAPDVSKFTSDFKSKYQAATVQQAHADAAKTSTANAVQAAGVAQASARAAALGRNAAQPVSPPPAQNPLDDSRVKALISLESDLTACVGKAG